MSSSSQRTKVLISEMLAEVLSSGIIFKKITFIVINEIVNFCDAGGTVIRGLHYAASEEFRLMVCYKQVRFKSTTCSFFYFKKIFTN